MVHQGGPVAKHALILPNKGLLRVVCTRRGTDCLSATGLVASLEVTRAKIRAARKDPIRIAAKRRRSDRLRTPERTEVRQVAMLVKREPDHQSAIEVMKAAIDSTRGRRL